MSGIQCRTATPRLSACGRNHGDTVSNGIIQNIDGVTDAALAVMNKTPNARLRAVMASAVRHLHAFAREVRLTQDEYDLAVDFLNCIGKSNN